MSLPALPQMHEPYDWVSSVPFRGQLLQQFHLCPDTAKRKFVCLAIGTIPVKSHYNLHTLNFHEASKTSITMNSLESKQWIEKLLWYISSINQQHRALEDELQLTSFQITNILCLIYSMTKNCSMKSMEKHILFPWTYCTISIEN